MKRLLDICEVPALENAALPEILGGDLKYWLWDAGNKKGQGFSERKTPPLN